MSHPRRLPRRLLRISEAQAIQALFGERDSQGRDPQHLRRAQGTVWFEADREGAPFEGSDRQQEANLATDEKNESVCEGNAASLSELSQETDGIRPSEPLESDLPVFRKKQDMGRRYYIHSNAEGVSILGGVPGYLHKEGRRVVHGPENEESTRPRCIQAGFWQRTTRRGTGRPYGSRAAVYQWCLSHPYIQIRRYFEQQQEGKSLRQCCDGILLQDAQTGTDSGCEFRYAGSSAERNLQIH